MSSTALIPVEEYLRLTEKPYCEYRDGAIFRKAMPTKLHSMIQYALLLLLRGQGVQALPELTVRISPTRYLVPDVVVAGDFPGPYATEPVTLCCEILSPEDRLGAMPGKCEEYHAWGVPYCWVIDPVKRSAWEYHCGAEPVRVSAALRAGQLSIGLQELFSGLDTAS
ncbi:MAG: Uma2 family endonuclease [Bryobacteraceae bacterium]